MQRYGPVLTYAIAALGADFTFLKAPKVISLMSKTIDSAQVAPSRLDEMVSNVFTWMLNEAALEQSIVSILCSNRFRELSQDLLGAELSVRFRAMLYSSSLAYVYDSRAMYDSDLSVEDLRRITYAMGSELLLYIDTLLAPHHLAKLPHDHLRIFFLVILGITLAVAYSAALYDSPSYGIGSPELYDGNIPKTLWQAMQQHLTQMMAHYLVVLASRLSLVLRRASEREFLSSLMTGLIRRGAFVWVAQQRVVSWSAQDAHSNTEDLFVLKIPQTTNMDPTTNAISKTELDSFRSAPVNVAGLQTMQNSLRAVNRLSFGLERYISLSQDCVWQDFGKVHDFRPAESDTGPSFSSSASQQLVGTRGDAVSGRGTRSYFGPVKKKPVV